MVSSALVKNNCNIGFLLDSPRRDLEGICNIAEELTKNKFNVFILPTYTQAFDLFANKISICVFNYCRSNNAWIILMCKLFGIKVVILDTEGNPNNLNIISSIIKQSKANHLCDLYLFWGKSQLNSISDHLISKERKKITGQPRFEKIFQYNSNKINNNTILFNTNFSIINPKYSNFRNELTDRHTVTKEKIYKLKKLAIQHKQALNIFIESLCHVSQNFPKLKIKVRVHPFEDEKYYADVIKKNNLINVSISDTLTSINDIYNSDIIVQSDCNTSLEAALINKPNLNLNFKDLKFRSEYISKISAIQINNLLELKKTINNLIEKKIKYQINDITKTYLYERVNFKPNSQVNWSSNVADEIKKIIIQKNDKFFYILKYNSILIFMKNLRNVILQIIRFILGFNSYNKLAYYFNNKKRKIKFDKYEKLDYEFEQLHKLNKYNFKYKKMPQSHLSSGFVIKIYEK